MSRRGIRYYIAAYFGGYIPPRCSQKGGLCCPLVRRGPVSPNTVPAKKINQHGCLKWLAGVMSTRLRCSLGCLEQARGQSAGVSCTPKRQNEPSVCPLPFVILIRRSNLRALDDKKGDFLKSNMTAMMFGRLTQHLSPRKRQGRRCVRVSTKRPKDISPWPPCAFGKPDVERCGSPLTRSFGRCNVGPRAQNVPTPHAGHLASRCCTIYPTCQGVEIFA